MFSSSEYDVLVVGAGPSGLVAATQAARAGARTLLVEKSGIVGGTTVLNGVNYPGLFHAWGKQIIRGIGWELIENVVAEDAMNLPDFGDYASQPHHRLQILVDRASYAALADRIVRNSGADVLLHTMVGRIEFRETAPFLQVQLCGKEGLFPVTASKIVDCTGDANAVGLAGFNRIKEGKLQPGTLVMRVSGFEPESLDYDALEAAFIQEVSEGRMLRSDFHAAEAPVWTFLKMRGANSIHVTNIDASTSRGKTNAEFKAREVMLRIQRFFRSQPGLKDFKVDYFAPECGIRETCRIDGEFCISAEDYCSGKVWEDSYCYSFYPIDLHSHEGGSIDTRPLEEGVFPTVPLRAMIPKGSRDLIVAGRCVCGDQAANSAFRVQASSMATGQVAGAVAALAALENLPLQSVSKSRIVALLNENNAIVPGSESATSIAVGCNDELSEASSF